MKFGVTMESGVGVTPDPGEIIEDPKAAIEQHLDEVMEQLLGLKAEDATIDFDSGTRQVTFYAVIEAADPFDAMAHARDLFRTAIHKAGGETPDWVGGAPWGIGPVKKVESEELELLPA